MNKKQTISAARKAFDALYSLDDQRQRHYRSELFALAAAGERQHRKFVDNFAAHHPGAASVTDCARTMAVVRLAEYLTGARKMPVPADYLSTPPECLFAAALVAEYRGVIVDAWAGLDVAALTSADYCALVRPDGV